MPMTMFFGFMGALIFTLVGPLLLILWCAALAMHSRGRVALLGLAGFAPHGWLLSGPSLPRLLDTRTNLRHSSLPSLSPCAGWRAWAWAA
jgi:hypothetical protein